MGEMIELLNDGKLPGGYPRFKCNWTNPEVDESMNEGDKHLSIVIKAGSTWRAAKEQLYLSYLSHMTSLDYDFNRMLEVKLHPLTRHSVFMDQMKGPLTKRNAAVGSYGLDIPDSLFTPDGCEPLANDVYRGMLLKIHKE